MDVHVRIGDNRIFALKQAVLVYQEGNRAFATLHEVKSQPDGPSYLCAGQSVTTGFLETLAKGLGASMAAEVLPEYVLARTPELIAWWSRAQARLMFFGDDEPKTRSLCGKMYPHPALVFMIRGRELFVRALAETVALAPVRSALQSLEPRYHRERRRGALRAARSGQRSTSPLPGDWSSHSRCLP